MSELLVDFITSLDGFGAAEGWPGFWGMESPEYLAWMGADPSGGHTVLMGAVTYRLMAGMAGATGELRDVEGDSVAGLTASTKVVFSATLDEPRWANTRLVRSDPVAEVRAMKEAGVPMRTLGSVSLCRSLVAAGVVDRFRVVVFPVVTGVTGRERIYDGWPDVRLELLSSRTFEGGLQMLEYAPTVLAGPPTPAPPG